MLLVVCMLLSLASVALSQSAGGECPVDYSPFQFSCYKVNDDTLSREEAATACEDDGGHLADIRSWEEQEFIVSILEASGGGDAWFGLIKDKTDVGNLLWSNGSSLIPDYTWQVISDSNTNEDCMRLREDEDYDWHDIVCDRKYKSICEFGDEIRVQLIADNTKKEGKVEIKIQGEWQAVCYDTGYDSDWVWNVRAALVVCRQLGFVSGIPLPLDGLSTSGYLVNDVRCPYGLFDHLEYCQFERQDTKCDDNMQAAVKCYADDDCPGDYLPFNGSCYKVNNDKMSLPEAARACEDDDGHLADIRSWEEQEFIVSILTASGGGDAWFGLLKNQTADEEYMWWDGSPLTPETWHDIDSDDKTVCMRLLENSDYDWRDKQCGREYKSVCELGGFSVPVTPIYPIRLIDGNTTMEGKVEIKLQDEWHAVCYDTGYSSDFVWNVRAALVVCRQLGFVSGTPLARYGLSKLGYHVNDVRCIYGLFDHLEYCSFEIQDNQCGDNVQAAVKCYAGDDCPGGYLRFQSSCYKVNNTKLSRSDAATACEEDGGHLADITSMEEQEFIVSILTATGGGDAWFGLIKDKNVVGNLIWSDGSSLIFDYTWQSISDSDMDQDCMRLREDEDYDWHDIYCYGIYKYKSVCEFGDEIVSTVSTTLNPVTIPSSSGSTGKVASEISGVIITTRPTSVPISLTSNISENPTDSISVDEEQQLQNNTNKTDVIAGSVVGVFILIILILIISLIVFRRNRKDTSSKPVASTTRSGNNNPTYEFDTKVEHVHNSQSDNDYNYVADSQPDNEYNYVGDGQLDNEYNYVDADQVLPAGTHLPDGNIDDDTVYSYAETPAGPGQCPSAPKEQVEKEGWMENTIYSTTNDGDTNAQVEGWADNNIYGN